MTPRDQVLITGAVSLGVLLGIVLTVALSVATHGPPPQPPTCIATASVVTRAVPVEIEVTVTDPTDCALLAMARIASAEGATVGRGRWNVARTIGALSDTCEEATALVALTRQESTWTPSAVSHAGACGVTQVRSCDAEGSWDAMPCCDEYRHGGHHCRPRCEWLASPENAVGWTLAWLRDRGGWDPAAYVGARDPEVGAGYVGRAVQWLEMASGGDGDMP